jgi:hypothetical protein
MRIIGATVAVVATAMILSSLANPALAFTPRLQSLFDHFAECKLLLLTDLQAHVRECGGGKKLVVSLSSLAEKGPDSPATVVFTPPVVDDKDCEGRESFEDHWCRCYEEGPPPS